MRSDSEMPMVEDVCRLQWLDARSCPIVSVALVRAHLPWWQQLIHRFHVWQRNECYLQIIITMSMHRADNVIYRNKCKINSKIEKRAFLLLLWPKWGSCLGLQMSPSWTFALMCCIHRSSDGLVWTSLHLKWKSWSRLIVMTQYRNGHKVNARWRRETKMAALPAFLPEALGDTVKPWDRTNHSSGLRGQQGSDSTKRGHSSLPASQGCWRRD